MSQFLNKDYSEVLEKAEEKSKNKNTEDNNGIKTKIN